MKRLSALLVMVLAAAACQREAVITEKPADEYTLVLNAYTPEPEGKVAVATSGKATWTAGDEIAVYNSAGQKFRATLTGGAGTSFGSFTCTAFSGNPGTTAVYPYAMAGAAPGSVTIPFIQERSDAVPALMASSFEMSGSEPANLYFKHIAPVIDLTLRDIPAYARAVVLNASGRRISGDFNFDTTGPGPVVTDAVSSAQLITFQSGEGYGTDVIDSDLFVRIAVFTPDDPAAGLSGATWRLTARCARFWSTP